MREYINIESLSDLEPNVVGQRLEALIFTMPERIKQQLNRCYYLAFSDTSEVIAASDLGKDAICYYFTEDPQSEDIN